MTHAASPSPGTKGLVERFHVCWDVWPEYAFINHEKRQIGFQLELSGTHEGREQHPEPGCEKCLEIYEALVRIAQDVLPPAGEDTICEFEPYDQGIQYSPRHSNRPEVVLRIRIVHRQALEQPVDAAQLEYLENLRQRLAESNIARS